MDKLADKSNYKSLGIEGDKYKTNFNRKFETRQKWQEPDLRLINAVLPGLVLKIHVQSGQEVKLGDKLLVFDAMKMKNTVLSPTSGIIKTVHIKEGQMIAKRDLLIEFI